MGVGGRDMLVEYAYGGGEDGDVCRRRWPGPVMVEV